MNIVEELQDIDKRQVESPAKEEPSPEEGDTSKEARADLDRASSRMLTTKTLNPGDHKKPSEANMKEIAETLRK